MATPENPFAYRLRARFVLETRFPDMYYFLRTLWIFIRRGKAAGVVRGITLDTGKTYESLFERAMPEFCRVLKPCRNEFRWPVGRLYNGKFGSVDAELMYSMIRHYKPRRMVEVGSGHSTAFAREAFRANGVTAPLVITSIDPAPRTRLPADVRHLAMRVEEAPAELFSGLQANDILSIDSSHLADETHYHIDRIYPLLKPGVLVHTHDIFYPYRPVNIEEKLLLDFYLQKGSRMRVLTGSCYMRFHHPDVVVEHVPSARWAINVSEAVPTSLWAVVQS